MGSLKSVDATPASRERASSSSGWGEGILPTKKRVRPILILMFCQGTAVLACAGVANLLATPTPLPSATPTATSTPVPTATATATATLRPTGVGIHEQPDGTTLVTDYDNLYQFSLGPDWEVVSTSSEDHSDRPGTEVGPARVMLVATKTPGPTDTFSGRVLAANRNPRFHSPEYTTNIQVLVDTDKYSGIMPLSFLLAGFEDGLKAEQAQIVGESQLGAENSQGVEIAKLEFRQNLPAEKGRQLQIQAKILLFQANKRLITVTLWTLPQFADEVSSDLDDLAETISLIAP